MLRPFLSSSQLLVTPVVALLTDLDVLATLRPCVGEVDQIFSHPLEAILDPSLLADKEPLVPKGSEHWPYQQEFYVSMQPTWRWPDSQACQQNTSDVIVEAFDNFVYRMHRFRSCASPIKGLTADILVSSSPRPVNKAGCVAQIHVAEIAYDKKTAYEVCAPGQAGAALALVRLQMARYRELVTSS